MVLNTCTRCGEWGETKAVCLTGDSGANWLCESCLDHLNNVTLVLWIIAIVFIGSVFLWKVVA